MKTKYVDIPPSQMEAEKHKLQGAIFKLLPYKENNYVLIDEYFDALLFRIGGLNELFEHRPDVIHLMSLIAATRVEDDFKRYRKGVLDACTLVESIGNNESGERHV